MLQFDDGICFCLSILCIIPDIVVKYVTILINFNKGCAVMVGSSTQYLPQMLNVGIDAAGYEGTLATNRDL